jgi:hypothetical protein
MATNDPETDPRPAAHELCELHRLDDLERLSDVEHQLEARGIEADIWRVPGPRRSRWGDTGPARLMVRCRDLVYARWIAQAAGLDTWPQEPGASEEG